MLTTAKDLIYLLSISLSVANPHSYNDNVCFGIKPGISAAVNNVCSVQDITPEQVQRIKSFYGDIPFQWWVDEDQKETVGPVLQQNGFIYLRAYPAMALDLKDMREQKPVPDFAVHRISNSDHDFAQWVSIVSTVFSASEPDIQSLMAYILQHESKTATVYLGFLNGKPAVTCLAVEHEDISTVSLHQIATLAEYRGKGLATAITHAALVDAKNKGIKRAILGASDEGKPLYEKMGFKTYRMFDLYNSPK